MSSDSFFEVTLMNMLREKGQHLEEKMERDTVLKVNLWVINMDQGRGVDFGGQNW